MVEEHSTSLQSRIDTEYPNSIPAPVLSPSCPVTSDLKLSEHADSLILQDIIPPPQQNEASCDVDVKSAVDHRKDDFKASRPSSIDAKRSKSLGNASSMDSGEDSKCKKDVKKTRSNPVKIEAPSFDLEEDDGAREGGVKLEEKVSPAKNCGTPEGKNLEWEESPKPGCSSQQDAGELERRFRSLIFKILPYQKKTI